MNDYIVTQEDIDLLLQSTKVLTYKLELLDTSLKVVDSIEGNLISDNISIASDSDVRRTYSCEMIVTDSTFTIGRNNKIWFDKRIRPYIGILNQRTKMTAWYCLGTFLYTDVNFNYDSTTKQLSLACNDMMCLLNDVRGGQLDAYSRTIQQGSDARNVIISLLAELGITKYYIEFNLNGNMISTFEIPYDLTYSAGTNAYTIIKAIVDLYSGTQMYFDLYGTFVISRIPTNKNEISILSNDIIQQILINEQVSTTFSNIYNKIQIWGKVNEPEFYTKDVTVTDNVYNVSLVYSKIDNNTSTEVTYDKYENFDMVALKIPVSNLSNAKIKINSLEEILIVDEQGNSLPENYLEANLDYVFRYRRVTNDFLFIGQYQCYGEAYLTNDKNDTNEYAVIDDSSEFTIEEIGEHLKVLIDGDYANITSNDLCRQRARYELYNATNIQDSLSISIIAIPFLDVNQIVEFKSNSTNKTNKYLITSISCNYSDFQMSVSLSKFYPYYI